MDGNRTDEDIARIVAVKVLLAKPDERETIMQTEIPFDRFARIITLVPGVMADIVDTITSRNKSARLGIEGVLRTFLRTTRG